jgi:calcium-dependent protein kinase
VAPEVLTGAYNNKCDVWSIGVITYMLLSGTPPFYGKDDIGTLKSVKEGKVQFDAKYFSSISNIAKNFIQICLTKNISKRPTAQTLLTHEWFASLHLALESQTPSLNILTRLVLFQKKSELTKLCMEVVAHTLTSKQIENLRIQFKLLDKTNTGEILLSDLKNVLQRQNGISAANLEVMFGGMDGLDPAPAPAGGAGGGGKGGGGSGEEKSQLKIKYHEFLAATLSRQNITENNMRVAFEKLSNCHEFITVGDIKDLLGKDGTDEEIKKMLVEVDIDPNNAKISYDNVSPPLLSSFPTLPLSLPPPSPSVVQDNHAWWRSESRRQQPLQ